MLNIIFDERKELKKDSIGFYNDDEIIAWDYAVEVEKMHVFPIDYDYGYLVFWGDDCSFNDTMVFAELQHLFDYLTGGCEFMEKAKAYADSKGVKEVGKEYQIEFVSYAMCTIKAKNDEEARELANSITERLNNDEEYRGMFGWDSCDIRYMVDSKDKYVIYN